MLVEVDPERDIVREVVFRLNGRLTGRALLPGLVPPLALIVLGRPETCAEVLLCLLVDKGCTRNGLLCLLKSHFYLLMNVKSVNLLLHPAATRDSPSSLRVSPLWTGRWLSPWTRRMMKHGRYVYT